jgi:CHAD domain-containing protein
VPDYEFVLRDAPEAAWAAVGTRYRVVAGPRHRQTRVWLDTFDGRLHRAGLTLAFLSRPGGASELVLTCSDQVMRQAAVVRWPALIDAVPGGPVADRLRSVVGVRALLPLARVRSDVGEWRLLNTDDKTVVRAYIDQASTVGNGSGTLPARIRLAPVRGYDGQAARVAHVLAESGLAPDGTPEFDLLLRDGWISVPDRAPFDMSLHPGQDAAAALAGQLLALWQMIEVNVPGVVDDVDTEFLHDLRVAVRRTRSMLKLAGDVLPEDTTTRFTPEFKWLGDLTTPVRDLDVLLLDFPDMLAGLTEAQPDDLAPLREHFRRERAKQRLRLMRGLRSARFADLAIAWRTALAPLVTPATGFGARRRTPSIDTQTLAAQRIDRAWRRVAGRARHVALDSPPLLLHDLRKRCKELRYVLELTAGLCRPEPHRALLNDLKAVQDRLGEFQDAEVHRDAIRGYATAILAEQRAGAATLLAMGELVTRYGSRQRQAAADAVARVDRLITKANYRRVTGLVVSG